MLAYRFNFFSWFAVEGLNVLVMCYIWLSVYSQGSAVGNYSLRGLISYFILSRIISMVVSDRSTSDTMQNDISQGRLTNYLLKPVIYPLSLYAKGLGETIASIILTIPVGLVFIYFLSDTINLSIERVGLFIISLALSSVIGFFIWFIVGLLSFYMENIFGVQFMFWLVLSVFSGRTVPLDILPETIQHVADILPFKYLLFIPLQIINGTVTTTNALHGLLIALIWLLVLIIISQIIYRSGLKKYEGQGA